MVALLASVTSSEQALMSLHDLTISSSPAEEEVVSRHTQSIISASGC